MGEQNGGKGWTASIENMLTVMEAAEAQAAAGTVLVIREADQAARDIVTGKIGTFPPMASTIHACACALMAGDPSSLDDLPAPMAQAWPDTVLAQTGQALMALVRDEPDAHRNAQTLNTWLGAQQAAEIQAFTDQNSAGLASRLTLFRAGGAYSLSAAVAHMAGGRQDIAAQFCASAARFFDLGNDIYLVNATQALSLACATSPLLRRDHPMVGEIPEKDPAPSGYPAP